MKEVSTFRNGIGLEVVDFERRTNNPPFQTCEALSSGMRDCECSLYKVKGIRNKYEFF